ncbi:Ig-like domain-containing protein [Actinomadura sp. 9N407]|uniref:L,D-transpeptidase n=1 Tax=Actinomadura sp. 9N407 TaxID=3375154 RepID=UPI00379D3D9A
MLISGCAGGGGSGGARPGASAAKAAPPAPAAIAIVPGDGTRDVPPDRPVTVSAVRGTLDRVIVRGGGGTAAGRLSADRRSWRSRWPLRPATAYTVTATGTGAAGERTSLTGRFSTLKPPAMFRIADVTPRSGETVGAGMPLIVTFDRSIARRRAVERALQVRMSRPVTGAWHWTGPRQVVFRPRHYWPAGQRVTLQARTTGVRAGRGLYGASGHVSGFQVGPRRISTVDVRRRRMTVQENGATVRSIGISAGKGGKRAYTTTNGVHLAMGKYDPVTMTSAWMGVTDPKDPRYYKKRVRHAVQISASGEYVHGAPWSIKDQGKRNVSHGCVNASPAFAQWFYSRSLRGDVINVTGTDRPLESDNGWGYWQIPWAQWVKGGAFERPIRPHRDR